MPFKDHFTRFPVLETARLRLRLGEPRDAADYYAFHSRPQVLTYLGHCTLIDSVEKAEAILASYSHHFACMDSVHWAITLRGEDRLIGTILITDFTHMAIAHFGYALNPDYWGQGIMTEALKAVTRCAIEHFEFTRLHTVILPGNTASNRVVEKAGYRREGLLRSYFLERDKSLSDCYMYSFLRRDLKPLDPTEVYSCTPTPFTDYRAERRKAARAG